MTESLIAQLTHLSHANSVMQVQVMHESVHEANEYSQVRVSAT
jgi:hypothetical protein